MPRQLVLDLAATSRNWSLPPTALAEIGRATPPDWEVVGVDAPTSSDGDGPPGPSADALAAVREAEVYFGFGISRPLFAAPPRLRWVQSAAAGVSTALFPELVESDVLFTNSAGIHAVPIAETVIGGVLAILRGLDIAIDQQRRGVWDKQPFVRDGSPIRELGECRVLVVGAGGIGSEVARRCTAFGAACTAIRRRPELGGPEWFARVAGPDALDRELGAADVLVLAAPDTPETRRSIDARRLDLLPAGAIVASVGRGSALDEGALAVRLAGGRLRGAVLDVFEREPLPPESPLWALPNAIITPHVAAVSPRRYWERELALFLDNWQRYRRGEPLRNVVDKRAGY